MIAFYGVGSLVMVPWVQDDLGDRVEARATAAGFDGVEADFSGQDGTLRCASPISSAADLRDLAEDVWGVRVAKVDEECVLAAPAPSQAPAVTTTAPPATTSSTAAATTEAAATTTSAAATTTVPEATTTIVAAPVRALVASAALGAGSSQVVLTGTVESAAQRDELVAAAAAAFGAENVVDQLEIVDTPGTPSDADATRLAGLIAAMTPNLVEGTASFDGAVLALTGVYVDDAAKAAIDTAAGELGVAAGDLQLTARPEASVDQAATLEAELNAAVGASPIPFDPNQSTLRPEADSILDQVAALARSYAGVTISVNGHTDSDGTEAGNLALSEARADTVRQALIDRGIPAEQLVAQGFGESQPVAANDTPANKALNRRVVFSVVAQ